MISRASFISVPDTTSISLFYTKCLKSSWLGKQVREPSKPNKMG